MLARLDSHSCHRLKISLTSLIIIFVEKCLVDYLSRRNANNDTWGVMVHAWAMVMPSRSKMTVPPRIWALGSKTPSSRIMMVALKISSTEYFLGSQFPKRYIIILLPHWVLYGGTETTSSSPMYFISSGLISWWISGCSSLKLQ